MAETDCGHADDDFAQAVRALVLDRLRGKPPATNLPDARAVWWQMNEDYRRLLRVAHGSMYQALGQAWSETLTPEARAALKRGGPAAPQADLPVAAAAA